MAVDVIHHVSPSRVYAKMAFGQKSKSTEELNTETAYPKMANNITSNTSTDQRISSGSDKSSTISLLDMSLLERSEMAVEQLKTSRKQLEDEIEVLTLVFS